MTDERKAGVTDTKHLRQVAEAATPGERAVWSSIYEGMIAQLRATLPGHERGIAEYRKHPMGFKDAQFAEAFDPPTVLSLLDEIDRLRDLLKRAMERGGFERWPDLHTELKAALNPGAQP